MNGYVLAFPIALGIVLLLFFLQYGVLLSPPWRRKKAEPLPPVLIPARYQRPEETDAPDDAPAAAEPKKRFVWPSVCHPTTRRDVRVLCLILAVYALAAFSYLGDNSAPQTFRHFDMEGDSVTIRLPQDVPVTQILYYTGLYSGSYAVLFSEDGVNYYQEIELPQSHGDLFKWLLYTFPETEIPRHVQYVRVIANGTLELGELAFFSGDGCRLPADGIVCEDGGALFDEEAVIPDTPTCLNSAYFDEIYHARTAYENVTNVYPYEVSHPPLGKLLLSVGIRLFGMTPFGWRFMGTLLGVLMLIPLYILIKNLFGSTAVSACGTLIFSFDFMHFTQTRIATIDTYAVLFILLMSLFMYRFLTADPDGGAAERRRGRMALALAGLSFGLGAASKWTVFYAGAGLAVLWLLYWIFRALALRRAGRGQEFLPELGRNILWCLLFFVALPAMIYYLSYYPYGKAVGLSAPSMFLDSEYLRIVLDNQKFMFTYHSGLEATHPYSSAWYQWLLDIRPILYYRSYSDDGLIKSAITAFVSPTVCWGGLLAMAFMLYLTIRERDTRALFILLGYLAQLGPWIPVTRITFAYHYFPSTVFLVLALCHAFGTVREKRRRWRLPVYGFTAVSLLLFLVFYPSLSGLPVPVWYTNLLRWLPLWPL